MRYKSGNVPLGFPDKFKFGIEIEAYNTDTKELYESEESLEVLHEIGWKPDTKEALATRGGAECVSGILEDNAQTWENLHTICDHIKKYPGQDGEEVVADEKCGCHVHFDATDLLSNPKMMENFLKLWVDSEELIYKMCNGENDPIRKNAINQELIPSLNFGESTLKNLVKLKTIKQIANFPIKLYENAVHVFIERRKGFASPSSEKILKDIEEDRLKVSYAKKGVFREKIIQKYKIDPRRYQGLNLTNLGSKSKNTIEFRMSNGTLDPETIKQNVYLYGCLLYAAKMMTLDSNWKQEELAEFQQTDCTEEEKVDRMLAILFDSDEDRKIYKDRWVSVKDAPVFAQNAEKGFATRFQREDIKQMAENRPLSKLQDAMSNIKQMIKGKTKIKTKEDEQGVEYGN